MSVIARFAERFPPAVGEKVTPTMQLAPGASEAEQEPLCEKSLGLLPVMASELTVSEAVPVFEIVIDC